MKYGRIRLSIWILNKGAEKFIEMKIWSKHICFVYCDLSSFASLCLFQLIVVYARYKINEIRITFR